MAIIVLITLLAFGFRLIAPIGTSYYNFQFCYFAAYIVFFYLGTQAQRINITEKITLQEGKKWLYIALLGIAKAKWNHQSKTMKFLSENTFGIYVFQAQVLIGLSILTKDLHPGILPKFFIIAFLAVVTSLLVSWLIRQIPRVGKIFN